MSRTVLIAEDEQALLESFAEIVEYMGHRPLLAHDGEEAFALAQSHLPDAIISDHMMPRCTGVELLRKVHQDPRLARVPFVLISAAVQPRGADAAFRFLSKPVSLEAFESVVAEALGAPEGAGGGVAVASAEPLATERMREETLSWVAHEVKTPLSAAMLRLDMLTRDLRSHGDEARARRAQAIQVQLEHMRGLVESVLDAAALSERRMGVAPARGDVASFLAAMVGEWRETYVGLAFELSGAAAPVHVDFDAGAVRRILDNLASNAAKYGAEGGRVEVGLVERPDHVAISVSDFGRGIPAAELPRVFDRFYRGGAQAGRGHGLGLYIAAALARLHGGGLTAQSSPGCGATFTLQLPRVA